MSSSPITKANIIQLSQYASHQVPPGSGADDSAGADAGSHPAAQPHTRNEDAHTQQNQAVNTAPQHGEAERPEWEQHFFIAPNVRFTRTPDSIANRKQAKPAAEPAPQPTAPQAQEPVRWPVRPEQAVMPQRPAVSVQQQAQVQPRPPQQAAPQQHHVATHNPVAAPPAIGLAHLSDHAFFELGVPLSTPAPVTQPVVPQPRAAAIAPVAAPVKTSQNVQDLTNFYRVIDCSVRPNEAPAQPVGSNPTPQPAPAQHVPAAPPPHPQPVQARPRQGSTAPVTAAPVAAPQTPVDAEYTFPPAGLLQEPPAETGIYLTQERLERDADLLESVLEDFGVKGEIIHARAGPVVTLYEFEPAPGVKSSRVINLADDIARSMSAVSARVAVVPGRNAIGIELPNDERETVYFSELIGTDDFSRSSAKLALALGKDIGGKPVIADLARMPHLLVAGTTGSGKSVAINTMILSLLYRLNPQECRLIMVDPKMLELSIYDGIPHLLTPVVTDPQKAVTALKWAVREMEDRYRKMARLGVRNIDGYNSRAAAARKAGETITMQVQTGFAKGTGEPTFEDREIDLSPMPFIVIIVDEMADLMMVAGKEIEGAIQRLAQMARAAGIHLIMATQRPSVDVITGTIKANFPTRISFQVTSKIDSRTILGEQGAEQLLGQGDMLHMAGGGRLMRVHGPFVSDAEVEQVVAHLKSQAAPEYLETVTADEEEVTEAAVDGTEVDEASEDGDDLFNQAVKVVMRDKKCSTSYIQRRLGIGYNRAASLVERMEKEGFVGAPNHVGKREILGAGS